MERGNILIVDDEAATRDMLKSYLTHFGFNVIACSDGGEAVHYYAQHHTEIDMVVLDLLMPQMDGIECLKGMKIVNPAVKCCVVSGYISGDKVEQLLALGVVALFPKPIDFLVICDRFAAVAGGC